MPKTISNPEDIIGEKFGKLTVVKYLGRKPQGRQTVPIYICKCDCGSNTITSRWNLKKGDTISCGCAKVAANKSRTEDLTGKMFGRWTVLEQAPTRYSKSGKTRSIMWKCKCVCGTVKNIGARALKTGMSTSCGCYQKEQVSEAVTDNLIGRRFGNLVVMYRSDSSNGNPHGSRGAKWHCCCDCGNELDVFGFSLKNGDTTSCGCRKSSKYEDYVVEYLNSRKYIKDVDYFREKTFPNLLVVGGQHLRFDFFVYCHNGESILIECQGEQHYRSTKWFGGDEYLAKVKTHDNIKKQFAKQNDIRLIEVLPIDITYEKVISRLQENGIY